jgi:glutathione-regulated potassium-efflux system protein KefB
VMVRAFDRVHMIALDGLDIAFAERELFEGAVAMGRAALKASGIDKGEIDRVDREYRMRDCERLERQSATGDLHAGDDRSFSAERSLPDARPEPAQGAPDPRR